MLRHTATEYRVSETSQASPDMTDVEFRALREDIRRNGQLVPILVRGIEIIDGRKRALACHELGIEPKTIDLSPEQDPKDLAYSLNIIRTHYTVSQRGIYGARRATATKSDAGRMRHPATMNSELLGMTIAQAAQEVGVSPATVAEGKRILRLASTEVVAAVEAGKLTLHSASQITGTTQRPEQAQAVQTVLVVSHGKSRQESARALGVWDGSKRLPKRNIAECIERGLDQIGNVLDAMEELFSTLNGDRSAGAEVWSARMENYRTRLTRLLRSVKE